MTAFYLVGRKLVSENTSEYGYGDFPRDELVVMAATDAETARKAQATFKKAYPNIRFGGRFGAMCLTRDELPQSLAGVL